MHEIPFVDETEVYFPGSILLWSTRFLGTHFEFFNRKAMDFREITQMASGFGVRLVPAPGTRIAGATATFEGERVIWFDPDTARSSAHQRLRLLHEIGHAFVASNPHLDGLSIEEEEFLCNAIALQGLIPFHASIPPDMGAHLTPDHMECFLSPERFESPIDPDLTDHAERWRWATFRTNIFHTCMRACLKTCTSYDCCHTCPSSASWLKNPR